MQKNKTKKKILSKTFIFFIISLMIIPTSFGQIQTINKIFFETNKLSVDNSYCDLLIIAPSNFVKFLEPLKEHKNNHGIRTNIVTLNQIYHDIWYGRDNPEKIKLFIKKAYDDTQIKYVLLVGNFRKVPVRYVNNADINSNEPYFISELYYGDIIDKNGSFSSWDTNNNGVYGEWNGNEAQDKDIDLYPDVCVGRLACRNIIEVRIMVNKIITYETSTYGKDWFNRIVGVAGDTYPPGSYLFPTPDFEGEENIKTSLSYMSGFEKKTLFTSDGTLTGSKDVIREINKGCGFLIFDGHANPSSWSTHPPNDKSIWVDGLSTKTMSKLKNDYMLPICVVGGCHNLEFDVNIFRILKEQWYFMTWIPECWGWKLTRKIGGGSIATIGCSGLGMTKEDKDSQEGASDFLDPRFFYNYGINNIDILGELWSKAISDYLDNYPIDWNTPAAWDFSIDAKTAQQWVLLGDPSLKIGGY